MSRFATARCVLAIAQQEKAAERQSGSTQAYFLAA
jgi:hypothetical protein